ncbi:biotin synthase BioB [Geosporobacter ferrireducens]|uniref:Biotin synthase n=1 Tax=Geosporobacter ferrireducens TaxID=1424294 RepID=A0A1D8GJD8_9FIRM|nr:biotin synthase BioB [Geosporobacter ferrireducens]AOT70952.1 biotin synthase BioB [Geosporobacter ferrireducens]MTI53666.1 biotin synthase BioB [Geosporobacter ferrireducens]
MKKYIEQIKEKILQGGAITFEEALELMEIDEMDEDALAHFYSAANEIRKKYAGNKVDLCTIMNAKSGKCSEDCKYCAQSVHYTTGVDEYDLLNYDKVLERAMEMEKEGAHRFSLVTSGRGVDGEDFEKLLEIYSRLKQDTDLKICASHGIISYEQAMRLKDAGVSMYHHNVETSSTYYEEICTTHSYQDRIDTIQNVQKAGMELCCGGIIGMGESVEDRVKMAFEIKELGVKSIPVNILNPIKGTPLEDTETMMPVEALKTMALYRFVIPDCYIRYAGGRMLLGDLQEVGFRAGVNAALVGNYLTTIGSKIEDDIRIIRCEGLEV